MYIKYDQSADAVYITLQSNANINHTEEHNEVNIDYDISGNPIGLEILDAHRFFDSKEKSVPIEYLVTA